MNFKALKKILAAALLAMTIVVGMGFDASSTTNAQDWRWRNRESRREWRDQRREWRERERRREWNRRHYRPNRYYRYDRNSYIEGYPRTYRNGYIDRWGRFRRY